MGNVIYEDVKILVSLKKLIDNNITIEEYLFLYLLDIEERWKLFVYAEGDGGITDTQIIKLIDLNLLELNEEGGDIDINNLIVTKTFNNIKTGKDKNENVENWINDWYELWPTGIKTSGYYLKTDKKGSLRKMKAFLVNYPEYSKEQIMQATKNYLLEQSIKGYSYTKLAPYFILKDGLSILAGECEQLVNDAEIRNVNTEDYGSNEL